VAKQGLGVQPLKLKEIVNHYKDCENSLGFYFSEKNPEIQNILNQYVTDPLVDIKGGIKFLKNDRIKELERSSSLVLLTAIEAWFMMDVKNRQKANLTDNLSNELINYITAKRFILLNDRFLDIWKKHHPSLTSLIGQLKDRFKYRHWLAHGRWFPAKTQKHEYSFEKDISVLAKEVLTNFPFFEGI